MKNNYNKKMNHFINNNNNNNVVKEDKWMIKIKLLINKIFIIKSMFLIIVIIYLSHSVNNKK